LTLEFSEQMDQASLAEGNVWIEDAAGARSPPRTWPTPHR
jgi:hypothetical protein